jgi:hypothetical protein
MRNPIFYHRLVARKAFVHAAELVLDEGVEPTAPGAAVTIGLCGQIDHEGPCRWPNNHDIDDSVAPARFRTVVVCEPVDEPEIRSRIEDALRGSAGWRVTSMGSRTLTPDEQVLGTRLARTSLPS